MRHGSLFSGIGGFDLAAQWMGWENVFQVEWDSFCQKVLTKNFPNVKRYGDIKEFDGTEYAGAVDIISGGFPCQPFSHAGKRKGQADDRYLWPEMLRVIREVKPTYVVGENVAGLVSMDNGKTLDGILSDLANEGYTTEQFIIPACGVGAWHRRDRIWIIAYSVNGADRTIGEQGREEESISGEYREKGQPREFSRTGCEISSDTESTGTRSHNGGILCGSSNGYSGWWATEPAVGRVANGIPNRVDRLKGLGNAIVPQVVLQIFKAIDEYSRISQ